MKGGFRHSPEEKECQITCLEPKGVSGPSYPFTFRSATGVSGPSYPLLDPLLPPLPQIREHQPSIVINTTLCALFNYVTVILSTSALSSQTIVQN